MFGSHSLGVTNRKKHSTWFGIAAAVNAVRTTDRTALDLFLKC